MNRYLEIQKRVGILNNMRRVTSKYSTTPVDMHYEPAFDKTFINVKFGPLGGMLRYDSRCYDLELVYHSTGLDRISKKVLDRESVSHGLLAELLWFANMKIEFEALITSSEVAYKYVCDYIPCMQGIMVDNARPYENAFSMKEFARVVIANNAASDVLKELGL